MGAAAHLLAFLSLSSMIFLHPVAADCVLRSATNPLYPFLQAVAPVKFRKTLVKQAPAGEGPILDPRTPSPISSAFEGLVKGFCSHTDYPDLCFSVTVPFLPFIREIDAAAVLGMQIKAATKQTHAAEEEATRIAGNPATEKMMATILQTCIESYDDALDNLEGATKAIAAHDMGTLNSMLSAAMTDYSTCEEGFEETPGINSPMTDHDDQLTKIVSNCLAIAELIKFK